MLTHAEAEAALKRLWDKLGASNQTEACTKLDDLLKTAGNRAKQETDLGSETRHDFAIGDTVNLKECSVGDDPGRVVGFSYDNGVKVRWQSGAAQTHPRERLRHEQPNLLNGDAPASKHGFTIGDIVNLRTRQVGYDPGRVIGFGFDYDVIVGWPDGEVSARANTLRHGA